MQLNQAATKRGFKASIVTCKASTPAIHSRIIMEAWQPLGLKTYCLIGDEARRQELLLDPHIQAAIYAPEESQVKAPQLTQAYYQAIQRLGAIFYPHEEVIGIQHQDNQVTEVVTAHQSISCKYLIITAGSWAAQCGEWLNLNIPVTPSREKSFPTANPLTSSGISFLGKEPISLPREKALLWGPQKQRLASILRLRRKYRLATKRHNQTHTKSRTKYIYISMGRTTP